MPKGIYLRTEIHKKNWEECRKKAWESNRGRHQSLETKLKLSLINKNISEEERLRRSIFMKGKKLSEETKHKISLLLSGKNHPNFGKHLSEETKRKIGEANSGSNCLPETRKKISLSQKGRISHIKGGHLTDEHKRKISITIKKQKPWMKGKHHTEEIRKKISNANKGKVTWNKGRKNCFSERTLKKLSETQKGSKSHFWKGGITPENLRIRHSIEFRLWREAVFARDNWTCQKCGNNKGGNLNSHHILNFAEYLELRFAIDNGITLCEIDHNKFHRIYGSRNNTKEQLDKFIKT